MLRKELAERRELPHSVMSRLAADNEKYVVNALARNPDTPTDLVVRMAERTTHAWTRVHLARHPNAPAELASEILCSLSEDKDAKIRHAVAVSPVTHSRILTMLAFDDDDKVATEAVASLASRGKAVAPHLSRDS